jgi:hypothetical protein
MDSRAGNLLSSPGVQKVSPPAQGALRKERIITMYHSRSIAGVLVCLVCLLTACGSQPPTIAETPQPQETMGSAAAIDTAPSVMPPATLTGALESPLSTAPVPITPPAGGEETGPLSPLPLPVQPGPSGEEGAVPGEVPEELLENILKDLQERKGIAAEEITIERAEAVVWRDGSLGCPQPGMMYLQVLTPGYLVVVRVGDDLYSYHAGESGHFILCEQSLPGEDPADPLVEQ